MFHIHKDQKYGQGTRAAICTGFLSLYLVGSSLDAADYYWENGSKTAFEDPENWRDSNLLISDYSSQLFVISGKGTMVLSANYNLNDLNFDAAAKSFLLKGSIISFADGGVISNDSSYAQEIQNDIDLGGAITFEIGDAGLLATGTITGSDLLTKTGSGILELTGDNDFGDTVLMQGVLRLGSADAMGNTGSVTFSGGTLGHSSKNTVDYSGRFSTTAGQSFKINTGGADITYASGLTSAGGSLTLSGIGGSLTLTGNSTYDGGTQILEGELIFGANNVLNSSGSVQVASGAILNVGSFSNSIGSFTSTGGVVSGTGTLTATAFNFQGGEVEAILAGTGVLNKTTSGELILSAANTYTGGTNILGGTITIDVDNALPSTGTVTINSGAILDLDSNALTIGPLAGGGSLLLSSGNLTIDSDSNSSFSGVISGASGEVTKDGTGTLTLSGANTYEDLTNILGGTLALGANNVLDDATDMIIDGGTFHLAGYNDTVSSVTLTDGAITGSGALTATTFDVFSGNISAVLAGSGALTKSGAGTVILSGTNSYTGGTLIEEGTLQLGASDVLVTSGAMEISTGATLDLNDFSQSFAALNGDGTVDIGNGTLTISSDTDSGFSGILDGTSGGSLIKSGSGTFTLSGMNTYSGDTAIYAGTLELGADDVFADSGSITLNGGTLDTVNKSDTIDTLTLNSGSILGTGILTASTIELKSGTVEAQLAGDSEVIKSTAGTISLGADDIFSDSMSLTIEAGTLNTASYDDMIDVLTLESGAISGTGTLTASAFNVESGSISAILAGNGNLTKTTAGALTLSGANLYTGLTDIQAGSIVLGINDGLFNTSSLNVDSGATFDINGYSQTVANMSGAGTIDLGDAGGMVLANSSINLFTGTIEGGTSAYFRKQGSNTLTLSGQMNHSGTTYIDSGILALGADDVFSDTGDIHVNSGILAMGLHDDTIDTLTLTSGSITGLGTLTASTINVLTGTISANLAGSAALTKTGAGTVILSGSNSYTGGTDIQDGILKLGANDSIATDSGVSVSTGAELDLNNYNQELASLTGTGDVTLGTGTLTLSQTSDETFGGSFDGDASSTLNLHGTATYTLSASHTHSGQTNIQNGTVRIDGAFNDSALVTVANNGILGGIGVVGALLVKDSASIAPGSGGTETLQASNTTLEGGGNYLWEINDFDGIVGSAEGADLIDIAGTLTVSATAENPFTISVLSLNAENVSGNAGNFDSLATYDFDIITTNGGITIVDDLSVSAVFAIDLTSFSNTFNGIWELSLTNNNKDLTLSYTPVPEPGTYVLFTAILTLSWTVVFKRRRPVKTK